MKIKKITAQYLKGNNSETIDFINYAAVHGAEIHQAKNKVKIKVPGKGSMVVHDSSVNLDPQSRRNYVRWFKVLGLLTIVFPLVYGMAEAVANLFGYHIVLF